MSQQLRSSIVIHHTLSLETSMFSKVTSDFLRNHQVCSNVQENVELYKSSWSIWQDKRKYEKVNATQLQIFVLSYVFKLNILK